MTNNLQIADAVEYSDQETGEVSTGTVERTVGDVDNGNAKVRVVWDDGMQPTWMRVSRLRLRQVC